MTIVLMLPKRIKNSFLFKSPVTSLPITAACPEPKPGRKLHKGEAIIDAKMLFTMLFFLISNCLNFIILCCGSVCFFEILVIKLDAPNNPVKRGRRGSFKFKFIEAIPKKPARKNIINAQNAREICALD